MLTVGLSAAAASYTLLDALLLRPLDIQDPERVVQLVNVKEDGMRMGFSYPMFKELEANNNVFDGLGAWMYPGVTVEYDSGEERAGALAVAGDTFRTLGVGATLGRVFSADDDTPGTGVVVLTHEYWMRRFAGDPDIVGKSLRIEWQPYTIVGVAARGFRGMQPGMPCELFIPFSHLDTLFNRTVFREPRVLGLTVNARLKPGVSMDQARAQLASIWPAILERTEPTESPAERRRWHFTHTIDIESAARGTGRYQDTLANPLYTLAAVSGLLLLVVCLNLANLTLAHALSRSREAAVKLALGAGRWRLVRQSVLESFILCAIGASLAWFLADWAALSLHSLWNQGPARLMLDLRMDARLFAFLTSTALACVLLAGGIPAIRVAWGSPATPMKDGASSVIGRRSRLGPALLAAQIAMSVVLLAGTTLVTRSLANLSNQRLDFDPEGVVMASLAPIGHSYRDRELEPYYAALLEDVRAIPGVQAAGFADHRPMSSWPMPFTTKGPAGIAREGVQTTTGCVGPGFFATLKTPLVRGRVFDARDRADASRVAVINEALAQDLFGDNDPIGHRIGYGLEADELDRRVVGVVRDSGYRGYRRSRSPAVYVPCDQRDRQGYLTIFVRTTGPTGDALKLVRERIGAHGVETIVIESTLQQQTDQSLSRERSMAWLSGVFSTIAVLLLACGLFALLSYSVRGQTREIGIRMALGADTRRVMRSILGRAVIVTLAGAAVGVPLAIFACHYLESLLFEVSPTDADVLAPTVASLLVVAVAAAAVPARRATKVQPTSALRHE